ncbi:MAG: hypothetical protein E7388_04840 [Ruminococcaceae bacterium]|nr:hypothetical protein [Oscillospiraceae bacterium]
MLSKIKNAPTFWKIFLIAVVVLVIASVIIWVVLWNYLIGYEKTRATVPVIELVSEINEGDFTKVIEYSNASKLDEAIQQDFKEKLTEIIAGQEVTYEKAFSKDKDNHPAFTLKIGDIKIATVTMEHTGEKISFGMEGFKIMSVTDIPIMSESVTITAPSGYAIFLNGDIISDKENYVVEKDIAVSGISGIPDKYLTKPTMVKYVVSDLVEVPEVTAKTEKGDPATIVTSDDKKSCVVKFGSTQNPDYYKDEALKLAKLYSQYVTAWVGKDTILKNVLEDSPIREGLASIQTGFYTDHKKDYFTDEKVENLQIYSDNCFSCDISYTQWVEDIRNNPSFKKALPSAFTFYFVKVENKWYIADLVIKDAQ